MQKLHKAWFGERQVFTCIIVVGSMGVYRQGVLALSVGWYNMYTCMHVH